VLFIGHRKHVYEDLGKLFLEVEEFKSFLSPLFRRVPTEEPEEKEKLSAS
jgi:hypothetical protein